MKLRTLCRATILSAAALAGVGAVTGQAAHADILPGNTPAVPFPAVSYSNGCSFPGPNLLLDQQVFPDPSPWAFPWAFFVSLRPACDMHDAAYSGGIVFDPVNGGIVNTSGMSRATADSRFFADLTTLCNRQIPGYAPVARSTCYGIAGTYFTAVRLAGASFFDAAPTVPGVQRTGSRANN